MIQEVTAAQKALDKLAHSFAVLTGENVTTSVNSGGLAPAGRVRVTFRFESAAGRDKAASMHAAFGMPAADKIEQNERMGVYVARWYIVAK